MTDEDIEKIIKQNMHLQMNLAGIQADIEAAQKPWVGLSEDEITQEVGDIQSLRDVIKNIEYKLKEKNTRNGGCL